MTSGVEEPANASGAPPTPAPPPSNLLFWCLASVVSLVVGFGAAHAPEQIKLIGPYAIVLGVALGAVLGRLGRDFILPSSAWVVVAMGLLILIAELANSFEAYRATVETIIARSKNQQKSPIELEYTDEELQKMSPASREIATQGAFIERCQRHRQTFSQYLLLRLLPLSPTVHGWSESRSATYWIAEITLATAAGTWLARRMLRS